MELVTDRLIIRSFTVEDRDAYAAIAGDPDVMRYLGGPVETHDAFAYVDDCIERDRSSGISRYAVVEKASQSFVGFCGFKALMDAGKPWMDFGWRYHPSVWRRGFGYEAALAVYGYGRDQLALTSIEARAHRDNRGSLRIIEKLGFVWVQDYDTAAGSFRRYREPG